MTRIIGHRGGRSLWPENSLGGFRNLLGLPVAGVELDIHLSDAGELLVIHDPTLDRTTDATGPVRALTPQDRARVRLKNCDEGIPVLSEVLPVFADSGFEMHLEIKADAAGQPYPGLPARVLAEVDRLGLRDRCVLTSFSPDTLRECRALAPEVRRLVSVHGPSVAAAGLEQTLRDMAGLADVVAIQKDLFREGWDTITGILPLGRLVAWTVNDPDELTFWLDRAVGFITSDNPVLACDLRRQVAIP